MAIPPILNGTGGPASESGVPSYNAVWNGSQWVPETQPSGGGGGDATAANQTAQATLTGALTESAPGTDTASSGLNGRLQRIAQRLSSIVTLLSNPLAVSQPGLSGGIHTTWIAVPTTANAYLPAAPLAGRATSLVQAWEGNALPIFIGEAGITARVLGATPGANDGILLLAGQNYPNPVAAGVLLCMRATATGCYVGIQEVAA